MLDERIGIELDGRQNLPPKFQASTVLEPYLLYPPGTKILINAEALSLEALRKFGKTHK